MSAVRVAFAGTGGAFSLAALQVLLQHDIGISHLLLAGPAPASPVAAPLPIPVADQGDPLQQLARQLTQQGHTPTHYLSRAFARSPAWQAFHPDGPAPDYLFMACFPYRLPQALTGWPARACLNLHPSLLPAYRGPDPLFWQLRRGETRTGVSLHHVNPSLDGGDLVAQQAIPLPSGATRQELDTLLATHGAELFCQLLSAGTLPAAQAQAPAATHYDPLPRPEDYTLSDQWSAQRAFNFIRGTVCPAQGYALKIGEQRYVLTEAISYQAEATLSPPAKKIGAELLLQFSPGVLRAKAR